MNGPVCLSRYRHNPEIDTTIRFTAHGKDFHHMCHPNHTKSNASNDPTLWDGELCYMALGQELYG